MSKYSNQAVKSYSVWYKNDPTLNEKEFADQVAEEFKTNHSETYLEEDMFYDFMESIAYIQDEPIADWVCFPLINVSKLAKTS